MEVKTIGIILVLLGCGGYGFMLSMHYRKEVAALNQLVIGMDVMLCDLEYRLPPLPDLCRFAGEKTEGCISTYFQNLANTLDKQESADVGVCAVQALKQTPKLPRYATSQLQALGQTLGRFDFRGQVTSLERCKKSSQKQLETLDIDLVFKIAAIGIIVSILNQVLSRSGREEQATMTTIAGLVVVLMMIAHKISELFDLVKTLFQF